MSHGLRPEEHAGLDDLPCCWTYLLPRRLLQRMAVIAAVNHRGGIIGVLLRQLPGGPRQTPEVPHIELYDLGHAVTSATEQSACPLASIQHAALQEVEEPF